MNDSGREPVDLTRLVKSITSGEPEEGVDRAMDESLQEFRDRLSTHPYVRRLERRGRIRPTRIWFVAGRPVAVRWAAAALTVLLVVVGLSLRQEELVPIAWAEVADQMAAIDRLMISMQISVQPGKRDAGEGSLSMPASIPGTIQSDEVNEPPPAAAMAAGSDEVRQEVSAQGVRSEEAQPEAGTRRGRGGVAPKEIRTAASVRDTVAPADVSERMTAVREDRDAAGQAEMEFYLSEREGFRWDVLLDSRPVSSLYIPAAGDSMIWLIHDEATWLEMPVDHDRPSSSTPAVEQDPEEYIRRFVAGSYRGGRGNRYRGGRSSGR